MNLSHIIFFVGLHSLLGTFPVGASPRPPGPSVERDATPTQRALRNPDDSRRSLQYVDCGMDPERPIRILNITAYPIPVRAPGKLKLAAAINVSETLPSTLGVDVSISKIFLGMRFKIPCMKNIGTCHYTDLCGIIEEFWADERCPRFLRRRNIPCRCPFTPGVYHLNKYSIRIPRMRGYEIFVKGEYEARVRIYDQTDKRELGCLQVNFQLRKRKRKSRDNVVTPPGLL